MLKTHGLLVTDYSISSSSLQCQLYSPPLSSKFLAIFKYAVLCDGFFYVLNASMLCERNVLWP